MFSNGIYNPLAANGREKRATKAHGVTFLAQRSAWEADILPLNDSLEGEAISSVCLR